MNLNNVNKTEGEFHPPSKKIAIVASRFNELVVEKLIAGAQDILIRHGVSPNQIDLIRVPGAFEIPVVCLATAKTNQYAGIITLGAVIRGETAHFDYVASAAANGVVQVQMQTGVPITFGVLTTQDTQQALARSGGTVGNKGAEAALALLETINVLGKIHD